MKPITLIIFLGLFVAINGSNQTVGPQLRNSTLKENTTHLFGMTASVPYSYEKTSEDSGKAEI